jgi:hypothetical protein
VPNTSSSAEGVRLAELLAVLSLGADLGMNQPMEHVLRQSLIALRLGELLGFDEAARAGLYHSSLIVWVGCHIDAYEQAKWFGDDLALKGDFRLIDATGTAPLKYMASHLGAGRPLLARARMGVRFVAGGHRDVDGMLANHWYAADTLARRLGLGQEVCDTIGQTFERWDGKGIPHGTKGEDLLLPARIVALADVVEVYHRTSGDDGAVSVARERSGTQFDPALVDLVAAEAPMLFEDLDLATSWGAVIDAEPGLTLRCRRTRSIMRWKRSPTSSTSNPRSPSATPAGSPSWRRAPPPRWDWAAPQPPMSAAPGYCTTSVGSASPTRCGTKPLNCRRRSSGTGTTAPVPDPADACLVLWSGRVRRDRDPAP